MGLAIENTAIAKFVEAHGGELARYDAMCQAIEECHRVDEVKEIRDRAVALEAYAAQAMNTEAERKACAIRLRAERRAGELLRDMKASGQRQKPGDNPRGARVLNTPTLGDMGISPDQSSKWQQLAAVPKEEFEQALRDPEKKPSTQGILARYENRPPMDKDALWIWGRLRDIEGEGLAQRDPGELFGEMTETMQDDVRRICPIVCEWLGRLGAL